MNPSTRIIISAYNNDQHQLEILNTAHERHECPITIMSPEDAPITHCCGHEIRHAGVKQYFGQESINRQVLQMEKALEFPEKWFLFHDSDSVILKPEFPAHWYTEPISVWSNEIGDPRVPGEPNPDGFLKHDFPMIPVDYHEGYPKIAMHPPWFMHRSIVEKFVELGPLPADPISPFIDWYYVLACKSVGVEHRNMEGSVSRPTANQEEIDQMVEYVKSGHTILHSVKTESAFQQLMAAYDARG
jgi:hypothetical protein